MRELDEKWEALTMASLRESKEAALLTEDFLKNSPEVNHGRFLHALTVPKVYTPADIRRFSTIVTTMDGIMQKIIAAYITDPAYRRLFPFSPKLEALILTPRLYPQAIPMARYDIFYNETTGDFKFCEINTDGTSAMNEDAICAQALVFQPVYRKLLKDYLLLPFELFDSWVRAFAATYRTYEKKVDHPYVAIVDFLEEACAYEFELFAAHFRRVGFAVEICEIRDLTFRNGRLISPLDHPIDVVYRRAVTGDIERHREETKAFCRAVLSQSVCVIGAFCTQIAHHKRIFEILWKEASLALLTKDEADFVRAHVPKTFALTRETCQRCRALENKDAWILKPSDSYSSRGVTAGKEVSKDAWEALLTAHAGQDYILQEYCPPYQTRNAYLPQEDAFKPYNNLPGLFAYNGVFAGVYSRLSDGAIISSATNKRVVPSLLGERRQ